MEQINNILNNTFNEEETSSFNFMEWAIRFLKYWYLFVLGVFISLVIAYYQNRSFVPIYNSSLRMLLRQEAGSLSYMQGQGFNSVMSRLDQTNIENQILLLQSQDLIGRTIDSLPKFRVDFYKKLQFKNRPMYTSSPINIDIISLSDISYGKYYLYHRKDNDAFTITVFDNEDVELETVEGRYNEPMGCKYFLIKIIENTPFRDVDKVHFRFRNRYDLVAEFSSKLAIQLIPNTSVLNISVLSNNPLRDVDFLTRHAQSFLDDNLDKKNYEADKTIQFINDQLGIISDSLSRSESNLNSFKVANKMYGQNNTSILTERMEALENQGKQIRLRDEYFKYLKNYLRNNIDNESLASPTTIGIQEPRLIALVDKYNELQIKLLDLGVKNPQYDVVMSQIRQIKTQLNELINSVSDVYKIEKSSYQSDLSALNKLLVEAPNKELRMLDYERRYKINDSYYTFLLQKRSEAQIRKASNSPDNAVMQKARTSQLVNANQKQKKYIIFFFIGLAIPAVLIILKELLNNAIRTEKDIERATKNRFPTIGSVRHTKHKADEKVIASKYPNSYFVEQLRVIRTKIEFILKRKEKITVLISSTESGDGKTYISLNLAGVFALQNKRILLIDFDIRKPNLTKNLGGMVKNKLGFVNYMIGDCSLKEAIEPTPYGFDFLKAGVIPPNPGEFVRSHKLLEMIAELQSMYDYIIIDSSPLGLVTDAYALFSVVDIKLLVVRSFKTNKMEFADLSKRLCADNIEDVYIILNDVDKSKMGYYGYGYGLHKNMGNYYVTEEFEQDNISILEKLIYKISDMTKKIRNIKK